MIVGVLALGAFGACASEPAANSSATASASGPGSATAKTARTDPGPSSATASAPVLGSAAATDSSEAERMSFPSGSLHLHGWVWKPAGSGPFPTLVYNHGSEQDPGGKPAIGHYFSAHGYLTFMPIRRGHGGSDGKYIGDLTSAAAKGPARQTVVVDELVAQVDDVAAGIDYLKTRPDVDPHRIVVAGCSYGGIETVLLAERSTSMRAGVDFAGASESWTGNPKLQARLLQAVDHATVPLFFLQAENDYNTSPTKTLSKEMDDRKKPHQEKIYPAHGESAAEGHGGFCTRGSDEWGPDVLTFLAAQLK